MLFQNSELFYYDSSSPVKGEVQDVDVMGTLSTWRACAVKEHLHAANMQIVKQICNSAFSFHHPADG